MTTSLGFTTTNFRLQSVAQVGPAVVRLRFQTDPKAISPTNTNDALNPANYTLSGPQPVLVSSVASVVGDPQSVDIYTNTPLATGLWSITVSTTIVSEDSGTTLLGANVLAFGVTAISQLASDVNGGAINDAAESVLRKHLPRSFIGNAWDAIVAALAVGDAYNWENTVAAFDQMFTSSASGKYLARRAADQGVIIPTDLNLPEEQYRQLAIRVSTSKLTAKAFWEVLEVFYGTDAVRAHLDSTNAEPFALAGGQTLKLSDNNQEIEISFDIADFAQINKATANEVVASINRQCRAIGFPVFAATVKSPTDLKSYVRIYSGSIGLASELKVIGGIAQSKMLFPSQVSVNFTTLQQFSITIPSPGTARYEISGFATATLLSVQEGDYVVVTAPAFSAANRGTFTVTNVSVVWNGSSYTQYFEVKNENVVAQAGPLLLTDPLEILVFRASKAQLQQIQGRSVIVAQSGANVTVKLPATTQAVGREDLNAAYVATNDSFSLSEAYFTAAGTGRAVTVELHSFVVGQQILLDSLEQETTFANSLLDIGKTAASAKTVLSLLDDSALVSRNRASVCALSDGSFLVFGGLRTSDNTLAIDGKRLTFSGSTVPGTGLYYNRPQYDYAWSSISTMVNGGYLSSFDGLDGINAGKALLIGGSDPSGVALTTARMYDSATNLWRALGGSLVARYNHVTVKTKTATDDIVVIIGGQTSTTTLTSTNRQFTNLDDVIATHTDDGVARVQHAASTCKASGVAGSSWMVTGGTSSIVSPLAVNSVWGFDEILGAAFQTSPMNFCRRQHAQVMLPDGRVMVIGGLGRNPSQSSVDAALTSCEFFDRSTGRWTPAPSLPLSRAGAGMKAFVRDQKVYLFGGGLGFLCFDIKKGQWEVLSTGGFADDLAASASFVFGYNGTSPTSSFLMVEGVNGLGHTPVNNQVVKITNIIDAYTVEFETKNTKQFVSTTGGTATLVAAGDSAQTGPYIWSPQAGPAITGTETTLSSALSKGQKYRSINVVDASDFPDEPGWLIFAFGQDNATFPVRYLGRLSGTELSIDYSFSFPFDLPTGSNVTLLSQKAPYFADGADLGSFYLTGVAAGRIAAQQTIQDIAAAGINLVIEVSYPDDKGLGNRGGTGVKVSDSAVVWGGDDLDVELATIRGD
jgi:hypothetical protein